MISANSCTTFLPVSLSLNALASKPAAASVLYHLKQLAKPSRLSFQQKVQPEQAPLIVL